ncbi:chromosomal replication initiator DnaA [Maritimibacter sp. 55A14]|uniref:HdaA/DnaA family protein n=1 Tax=Maritimibacter sp. 55A14 TaxID=2174844 RepID=UPI000D6044F3|nr:DnaA/Hda family protein [Maritimibacter sp. 55A14]PWE31298.1 chromosomal replication initiator DnaA [Maritimibacter sp. 55A14]
MGRQLAFDLPVRPALGRAEFFVSPANALAVHAVDGWAGWPLGKLVLTGPPGSGKTHLAHVWAAEAGARIVAARDLAGMDIPALAAARRVAVEDVPDIGGDAAAEEALFHLHNLLAEAGGRLLLTGAGQPARWPIALPDLASRVQGASVATLEAMDDQLLTALLVKLFADRQLNVGHGVIAWLVRRMERSFAEARRIVSELDRRALAEKRKVTRDMAAAVVDNPGDEAQ